MHFSRSNNESDLNNEIVVESNTKSIPRENNRKSEPFRCLDGGDGNAVNLMSTKNTMVEQRPECLGAGECPSHQNSHPDTYQYRLYPETHATNHGTSQGTKPMQFTKEMIQDQELLVTSMSQQGIPETLIRRQFDRLLDEQSKQLRLVGDAKPTDKRGAGEIIKIDKHNNPNEISSSSNSQRCLDNQCSAQVHPKTKIQRTNASDNLSKIQNRGEKLEASSLLKIRLNKETLDSHNRNNGLQDPAAAHGIIKKCNYKRDTSQCVSSTDERIEKELLVRLNGTQDKSEMDPSSLHRTLEIREKQKSANGLANSRNPGNPPVGPKSCSVRSIPSQECAFRDTRQNCQTTSPAAHNDSHKKTENELSVNYQSTNHAASRTQSEYQKAFAQPTNNVSNEHDVHMPHNNLNNLTYWPEFQEPRVIGGITYFARKPQCIPNVPVLLCDNNTCVHK